MVPFVVDLSAVTWDFLAIFLGKLGFSRKIWSPGEFGRIRGDAELVLSGCRFLVS